MVVIGKITHFNLLMESLILVKDNSKIPILFNFMDDTLTVKSVIDENTALINVQIPAEVVTPTTFVVDIDELIKVKSDSMEFGQVDNRITINGSIKGSLPIIVNNTPIKELPNLAELWHTVEISPENVKAINTLINADNDFTFTTTSGVMRVDNNVVDKLNLYHEFTCNAPDLSSKFSGHLLTNIFKSYKHFTTYHLSIGNACPMKLEMSNNDCSATFVIAPMIKQE